MSKKLLMFSGGPDSTSAAYLIKKNCDDDIHLITLSDHVKAKNNAEVTAATHLANILALPHTVIDISSLNALLEGLPNTLISLGTGGEKKSDFVHGEHGAPLSSQLLHTLCALHGIAHGYNSMIWAVHDGDNRLAGPKWIAEYAGHFNTLLTHSGFSFALETPFLHYSKAQLLLQAMELGAPINLTFSCITPGVVEHCGECDGCRERNTALREIEQETLQPELVYTPTMNYS